LRRIEQRMGVLSAWDLLAQRPLSHRKGTLFTKTSSLLKSGLFPRTAIFHALTRLHLDQRRGGLRRSRGGSVIPGRAAKTFSRHTLPKRLRTGLQSARRRTARTETSGLASVALRVFLAGWGHSSRGAVLPELKPAVREYKARFSQAVGTRGRATAGAAGGMACRDGKEKKTIGASRTTKSKRQPAAS
jgi:hypothetical protein